MYEIIPIFGSLFCVFFDSFLSGPKKFSCSRESLRITGRRVLYEDFNEK